MAAAKYLAMDSFWVDKSKYDEAERQYYERLGHAPPLTPLTAEIAKARQRIIDMKREVDEETKACTESAAATVASAGSGGGPAENTSIPSATCALKTCSLVETTSNQTNNSSISTECHPSSMLESKCDNLEKILLKIQSDLEDLKIRVSVIENTVAGGVKPKIAICPAKVCTKPPAPACSKKPDAGGDDDDDVDLFNSDSEDDESAAKVREERLAAYAAKKSNKPALIAKSSIILDVKPWDDETDMKKMEEVVRKIECDGLLWGASKLVPLAYGIRKLQINCVVEDEKVSIDWLQEQIESNEDYVQSVDIAAFNKI